MIDRSIGPKITTLKHIHIPDIEQLKLDNGLKVDLINAGSQDIIKIELIHQAGRSAESTKMASRLCAASLKEGTQEFSGNDIAEKLDFYGATLSSRSGMDSAGVVLYTLRKYLDKALPIFHSVATKPAFNEKEIEKIKKSGAERLQIQLSKNDVLAYRKVTEELFGADHPYGYNSTPQQYLDASIESLKNHFQTCYNTDDSRLVISGKIKQEDITLINSTVGQIGLKPNKEKAWTLSKNNTATLVHEEGTNTHQMAIRMGKKLFTRGHKDYPGMYVLNCILGGYFGSRLMKTIREEKGYTYGVYSVIDTMRHEGYFYISTEVSNELTKATIAAIREEIVKLQNDLVGQAELDTVKNYIMGNLMTMVDGPFKTSELLKTISVAGLDMSYFKRFTQQIRNISAQELLHLSQQYLDPESLCYVTAGKN